MGTAQVAGCPAFLAEGVCYVHRRCGLIGRLQLTGGSGQLLQSGGQSLGVPGVQSRRGVSQVLSLTGDGEVNQLGSNWCQYHQNETYG